MTECGRLQIMNANAPVAGDDNADDDVRYSVHTFEYEQWIAS
jgi:hypothetical protein